MICLKCNNSFFSKFRYLSHVTKNCDKRNYNDIYDELKKELKTMMEKYESLHNEICKLFQEKIPVKISQTQHVFIKNIHIVYILIIYCDIEFDDNFHNKFSSQEEYNKALLTLLHMEIKRISLSKIYSDLLISKALPAFSKLFKNDCGDGFNKLFDSLF